MKAEFIAATIAEQHHTSGPAEICAVLNRLPPTLLTAPDAQVIDQVDALMDDLYRQGALTCPGHRWLTTPPPTIHNHLLNLHTQGHIHRHAATGEWRWNDVTSHFSLRPFPSPTATPSPAPGAQQKHDHQHQVDVPRAGTSPVFHPK
ncbi:hypothetical protein GCM10009546_06920 [Actinomadura livida]|uniref:Uncharacterized protein n=1 Tax=Actinomadura livida TaxID=79909 RepID=A0ABN1DMK9_9ACTN|nr:hypothetical protein GCM10010208_55750 [Actinomadura livida]